MLARKTKVILILALSCLGAAHLVASAQQEKRPFAIADDIQLAVFAGSWGTDQELVFSPDHNYFFVETERGRLDLNRPEGSLRFYRCQDVEDFLKGPNRPQAPSPIWVLNRSTDQEGRILKGWRWLPDSSGVAFLERLPNAGDSYRLIFADVTKKKTQALTSAVEAVKQFDVRDRQHYVYTAIDLTDREKVNTDRKERTTVGTGHSLNQLLLPEAVQSGSQGSYLWAFAGGQRFEVKQGDTPLIPEGGLALSPDARSVVTALAVSEVPVSWETLYPPPFPSDAYRLRAGHGTAHDYVQIDLQTGSVHSLTNAPISNGAGLWAWSFSPPSWSSDGQAILLPGTYLKSRDNSPSRPCMAVVNLDSTATCVEMVKGSTETGVEEGRRSIQDARFAGGDKHRILVRLFGHPDYYSMTTVEYRLGSDGSWQIAKNSNEMPDGGGLRVAVKGGLNDPPVVVAAYRQMSRIIWDPNPQLKDVELSPAGLYTWRDEEGRHWSGGLFKPHGYKSGRRYPLVIQTHGFTESRFIPSGVFPTAFAARALAAAGIAVLQVPESTYCPNVTPGEGPCVVAAYEAAVNQLVSEGLVDPERIGIIGFSRTCFYVMEALTTGSLHLKAASITDGFLVGYFQYMVGLGGNEANSMIGAPPFADGLQQWLKRSPEFNLHKVNAPLLDVALGRHGLLLMWEPYAGLRYLQKPVDLIMLNTNEHVLSNPAMRMASQGGTVDWFRFWLQDYQDPDSTKAEQYARWRELRTLQEQNASKSARLEPVPHH